MTKLRNGMIMAMKRLPLLPKSVKKDTLFSDQLRSEPHPKKGTLFCEFLNTHVNTYRKCGPPGTCAVDAAGCYAKSHNGYLFMLE